MPNRDPTFQPSPTATNACDRNIEKIINDADGNRDEAYTALLKTVYDQLRQTAQHLMQRERVDHTLSATAIVHDAYIRLIGQRDLPWQNRAHFYAAACRGGPDARRAAIELSELPDPNSEKENAGFLILHDAISRLEHTDPQAATVVRLRYFAGLSRKDTASALGVSEPTVARLWAFARAWLKDSIERDTQ